jgi:hypothetical protein
VGAVVGAAAGALLDDALADTGAPPALASRALRA